MGLRVNYKLASPSALQLGYRYYWDDWEVRSHTVSTRYQHRLSSGVRLGLGVRSYVQSKAFFFEPEYSDPMPFMAVDSKLDKGYTTAFQLDAVFGGSAFDKMPVLKLLADEKMALSVKFNFYQRHTASPDWHSRFQNLYAYVISVGYRYRF